jgi:hypothetical protein
MEDPVHELIRNCGGSWLEISRFQHIETNHRTVAELQQFQINPALSAFFVAL